MRPILRCAALVVLCLAGRGCLNFAAKPGFRKLDGAVRRLVTKLGLSRPPCLREFLLGETPAPCEYNTWQSPDNDYVAQLLLGNLTFHGAPCSNKLAAERSAAVAALWALQQLDTSIDRTGNATVEVTEGYFRVPPVGRSLLTAGRKVIGKGGAHMQFIARQSGARIALIGRGSKNKHETNETATLPLSLHIKARNASSFRLACSLAQGLVEAVMEQSNSKGEVKLNLGAPYPERSKEQK